MKVRPQWTPRYLDKPEQWVRLAGALRKAGAFGLDSEFWNVDVKKQSCFGRAKVHVWSVAYPTGEMDPRGYSRCYSFVLPAAALACGELRNVLEDAQIRKEIHNQPVDEHAFASHGIKIRGGRNTLGLLRYNKPGLINQPGRFKLKTVMGSELGREPICTFQELVSDVRTVTVYKDKKVTVKGCSCGNDKCRLRKGHKRWERTETVKVGKERKEKFEWPLEEIVPGHKRFQLLVDYAAEDAVAAYQLGERCDEVGNPAPYPYHTDGEIRVNGQWRPGFSQALEDAVIIMEQGGIPVDVAFAQKMFEKACDDERAMYLWLHNWYVRNSKDYGPHRQGDWVKAGKKYKWVKGTNAVWTSGQRLLALFDRLKFPRSPIWQKGRTKPDKPKLDETALRWIADNHPPAKRLVEAIILFKRVRNGKKYHYKLANSGGMINPICGPAGDDDEKSGAVTGRLGVKGEFEAQQMPQPNEDGTGKDLYDVRRGIMAGEIEYEGELVDAMLVVGDYSSLEIGILGELCGRLFGDWQLRDMYLDQETKGVDLHSNNARAVFGKWLGWKVPEGKGYDYGGLTVDHIPVKDFKKHPYGKKLRNMIKAIWYGLSYGKGAWGFATLKGDDGEFIGEELAQQMIDALLDAVPAMRKWFAWVQGYINKYGGIYSLCGRWNDLSHRMQTDDEWQHKRAYRQGYNFPMQATGAGIIGDAMRRVVNCPRLMALGYILILNVHDELVLRGPAKHAKEAESLLREHMMAATANGVTLLVALQVSTGIGKYYSEAK